MAHPRHASGGRADRVLRVVFFGTPQFAVPSLAQLADSPHTVCGVVTQPDRARGRGQRVQPAPVKAFALERHFPVLQPDRLRTPDVEETLRTWSPDLGVVAAYGKLIPPSLLAVPRLGMINVHASLLPKYRGAAPIHRSVIAGDTETGVTIMRVAAALDAGAMFGKARRAIAENETSDSIEHDLAEQGALLLMEVISRITTGDAAEEEQDHSQATYAPKLTKEEGLIDWQRPARDIHNLVRGLFPWPHAYTYLEGRRLVLWRTLEANATTALAPGTIAGVNRDAIVVAAGNGSLLSILELQPEGRRPMRVQDFLAGHPLRIGARFGSA